VQAHEFRVLIRGSLLAQLLDGVEHAVTLANSIDEIIYVNPAFTRRFGWREEEIVGLKPVIFLPEGFSESDLKTLRQRIAEPGVIWAGAVRNRNKNGDLFTIELVTFSINLIEALPTNLHVGISAEPGLIAKAFGEVLASLCRFAYGAKTVSVGSFKQLGRPDQIENLYASGYNTKEIAGFMNLGHNTPHVILHRARRKKA
jgi:PAS domain S-box-containing protein